MLTNPRDAFKARGQSRSPNSSIPYVRHSFLLCKSNFVFKTRRFRIFDFKNAVTLKTGLGVRQRHWKYHPSTERIQLPVDVL